MSKAINGYISKEDALRTVCYDCCCYNQDEECCGTSGTCADYDAICKIPSADVQPVVRGEWEEIDRDAMGEKTLQCGRCGQLTKSFFEPNFCHHCGADMQQRGESTTGQPMSAVEYERERQRFSEWCDQHDCVDCEYFDAICPSGYRPTPEERIDAILKWAQAHPRKRTVRLG